MKKILVVNMNYLGDALMTTPVHFALRRAYPKAQIDAIAGGRQGYGAYDILAGNPHIDNLIVRVTGGAWPRSVQLFNTIVHGRYDAVVILPPIVAYRAAAALAGARKVYAVKAQVPGRHMCDTMLQMVSKLIGGAAPAEMVLKIPAEADARAAELLPERTARPSLVGVNVGASRPQKRWPIAHFEALVRALNAAGRKVVLLGADTLDDRTAADALSSIGSPSQVIDLVGKTTIMELGAVISRCDIVVSADTGAMHIAAALGTPVVAIFGSTDPKLTGPYGGTPSRVLYRDLACAPCNNHPTCGGKFDCLREITPDDVLAAVNELVFQRQAIRVAVSASAQV